MYIEHLYSLKMKEHILQNNTHQFCTAYNTHNLKMSYF